MIIQSSAIPHRWRNRFLRESSSNFVGSVNPTTVTPSSDGYQFEPHYLWGQYFDDTEDIDGDLTSNGTIQGVKGIFDNVDVNNNLQANYGIFGSAKVNGLLDTNQLKAVSGYIQTLLSDNITTDYLTVTKAAHFFKLIIDEIKASQGAVIITPANAKLDKVEEIENGYRCYYRANDDDGNQIYNCFEVNDQVVCQTFNASTGTSYNVSNKYYWRLVTATGSTETTIDGKTRDVHYFDLSSTDCDLSSSTPSVGDECVQLGNRSDTTRQAAIIISAYNSEFLDKGLKAPSFVQYAGINDYNLANHRLNIISNGLNQFKGSYNNNSGKNIETIITETATTLNGEITTLSGTVTSHTQSISELTQTDSSLSSRISANTTSIGTLNNNVGTISGNVQTNTTNISTLQQTAQGLTSTVQSQGQSITSLNNSVTNLNSSVTTNTQNISTLQQTAQGLTSTVSAHTQQISNVSGDVSTIQSDYVTSTVLNQTASSITLNVYDQVGNDLNETGIDIENHKINLKAETVNVQGNSGANTYIVLGTQYTYPYATILPQQANWFNSYYNQGRIGAGSNGGWASFTNSNSETEIDPDGVNVHKGGTTGTHYASIGLDSSNNPYISIKRAGTELYLKIDSNGNIRIGAAKNGTVGLSAWPKESQVSNGEIFINGDDCLEIKNV